MGYLLGVDGNIEAVVKLLCEILFFNLKKCILPMGKIALFNKIINPRHCKKGFP